MERIACIIGNTYIYWSTVITVLAAAAAVCTFLALYLRNEKSAAAAVVGVPAAVALSLVLSRLAHWYFRPDGYGSMAAALDLHQSGGFVLMGAFAGCILTALLLRLFRLTRNLPELLDCVSLAGAFGIAVGRLASFFNTSDRGMILGGQSGLPWVSAVINPVSGLTEYRLATFMLQAMGAGMIFLILLVIYMAGKRKAGEVSAAFLLFYGAVQVVLDSTRYDSLYLRSNGFVSAVQVLAAAAIALAVIFFAAGLVRAGGWKKWHGLLWLGQAGCFALAGYMEYYVQRHGNEAVFAYSVMGGALAGIVILSLLTRHLAVLEEKKHAQWLQQIAVQDG